MKLPNDNENKAAGSGWMSRLVSVFLNWPRNATHTERRYWSPWWIIGWRSIWLMPALVLRIAYVAVVAVGWGRRSAEMLWEDLK